MKLRMDADSPCFRSTFACACVTLVTRGGIAVQARISCSKT